MTLHECTIILTPFVQAMRADFDAPTLRAYHRVLQAVPVVLLEPALDQLIQAGARFMPTAPEILAAAEKVRRQQLALYPHIPCVECEDSCGWVKVLDAGVPRMRRCPCRTRHLAHLQSLGLAEPIAQLAGEGPAGSDPVFPTVEQLPARVRVPLEAMSKQKVLR